MATRRMEQVAAWAAKFGLAFFVLLVILWANPTLIGISQSYALMFPCTTRTPFNSSSAPASQVATPARPLEEISPFFPSCAQLSSSENQWFQHCNPPTDFDEARLEAYVQKRLSNYTGSCPKEAQKFHCLEYAARHKGWCDWSKAIEYPPISPSQFVTPEACTRVEERLGNGGGDSGALFFYPVYKQLELLKRQIAALEHPRHAFLLQLDAAPYANETLVSELVNWAASRNDVCVAQYGRVLYTSANQILIAFPAMTWAEQNLKGWGHFVVTGAQTYPVVTTQTLREVLTSQRHKNVFSSKPGVNDGNAIYRLGRATLESCIGADHNSASAHNLPEGNWHLQEWVDDFGTKHGPQERFNWLDTQLDRPWLLAKVGGLAQMLTRELVAFLLHDPNAKMFVQYFTYTPVASELLVPTVTSTFFPESISEYHACFMTWEDGVYENVLLSDEHWDSFADGGKTLFARKFKLPGSEEILARIDKELRGVRRLVR